MSLHGWHGASPGSSDCPRAGAGNHSRCGCNSRGIRAQIDGRSARPLVTPRRHCAGAGLSFRAAGSSPALAPQSAGPHGRA